VIYIDRLAPHVQLIAPTATCSADITSLPFQVVAKADDLTVDRVHIFIDRPEGTNLQQLANLGIGRATRNFDTFTTTITTLASGNHRIDILAYESAMGHINQQTFVGIQSTTGTGLGAGDLNADGHRDGDDIAGFVNVITGANPNYSPASDINC